MRLNEPSFRKIASKSIRRDLRWFFGKPVKNENKSEEMAPLFLFLASSFNVELVYVILNGITQFSYLKQTSAKALKKKGQVKVVKDENGNTTIHMSQIKIKDF